jgi:hypothetical protein
MKTTGLAILSVAALGLAGGVALAQNEEFAASNATLEDGQLTMDLVAPEAGWAVVHTVDDQGKAGAHIGHAAVEAGENAALAIPLDQPVEGDQLMVMLHEDAGAAGTFEFSGDDKTDAPVMKDGAPVSATVDVGQ